MEDIILRTDNKTQDRMLMRLVDAVSTLSGSHSVHRHLTTDVAVTETLLKGIPICTLSAKYQLLTKELLPSLPPLRTLPWWSATSTPARTPS